jgi:hypothetical protein
VKSEVPTRALHSFDTIRKRPTHGVVSAMLVPARGGVEEGFRLLQTERTASSVVMLSGCPTVDRLRAELRPAIREESQLPPERGVPSLTPEFSSSVCAVALESTHIQPVKKALSNFLPRNGLDRARLDFGHRPQFPPPGRPQRADQAHPSSESIRSRSGRSAIFSEDLVERLRHRFDRTFRSVERLTHWRSPAARS